MEDKVVKKLKVDGSGLGVTGNASLEDPGIGIDLLSMIKESETFNFEQHKKITIAELKAKLERLREVLAENKATRFNNPKKAELFVDSEAEIHEILRNLTQISTDEMLIIAFSDEKGPEILIEILKHPNQQLVLLCVSFLTELIDFEENPSDSEVIEKIGKSMVDKNLFGILISIFDQYKNQRHKEAKKTCFKLLSIIENSLEIDETYINKLGQETSIMGILTEFICQAKLLQTQTSSTEYNNNHLYSSEILSIVVLDEANQRKFGELHLIEAILTLLRSISEAETFYEDEKEMYLNLFNTLNTVLIVRENQEVFLEAEGMEIMMKLLKKKQFYSLSCLKTISFTVTTNPRGCRYFLENKGLRYIFPILNKKALKSKDAEIQFDTTKRALSIIFNLVLYLDENNRLRVLLKLLEKQGKTLVGLFKTRDEIDARLSDFEKNKKLVEDALRLDGADEDLVEAGVMAKRMENGLVELLYLDFLLLWSFKQSKETQQVIQKEVASRNKKQDQPPGERGDGLPKKTAVTVQVLEESFKQLMKLQNGDQTKVLLQALLNPKIELPPTQAKNN